MPKALNAADIQSTESPYDAVEMVLDYAERPVSITELCMVTRQPEHRVQAA